MSINIYSVPGRALDIAISQLGVTEQPKGSNKGKEVERYLASVGLKGGYAWCQAFVFWCFEQAGKSLDAPNPVVRSAGVLDCWNRTANGKKLLKVDLEQRPELIYPGSQFIMKFGNGTGHTGIIERMEGFIAHTIEGNTNDEGSREGYEVCRKIRHVKEFVGVIRY